VFALTFHRPIPAVFALLFSFCCVSTPAQTAKPSEKVFRYAFPAAETGFDPAQLSDLYSRILTANMFDALYTYDYLARPLTIRPNLAAGMPEVSADFKTFTVKLKPGVYFSDDPVFKGSKRELVASDVVYTYKRIFDPQNKSPSVSGLREEKIIGMEALRDQATKTGKFDYDLEIEGLRALDKYTVQFKLGEVRPRFLEGLTDPGIFGIVAREVVEAYGDRIMEHPVGTGPFQLSEWRRSSKITLVRNPNYRDDYFEATPPADSPLAQQVYGLMKGRKLPQIDKVEVSIIEESQPRWLAFLGNEHDLMERLPAAYVNVAIPQNKLAPNLQKRGIQMQRNLLGDVTFSYFGMENPIVGGYTPDKIALRRAIAMGQNSAEEVRLPRRGQAIVAQGPIMPMTAAYDPNMRSEMGVFDRAKAMALLDLFGYTDKDGDGWRDLPDGKPLTLEYSTTTSADYRELNEIWKKNMDAIGIRVTFKYGQWPELLKASRNGKLMMWGLGLSGGSPDGAGVLALGYSQSKGQQNHARFSLPEYDELYRQINRLPDGPERKALVEKAIKILVAYMPYKFITHRIGTDLTHPWVQGYVRNPIARDFWKYIDIDVQKARQP
jgi:ABC-type transport system substrate-binding protein